jgi:hypothetical protein
VRLLEDWMQTIGDSAPQKTWASLNLCRIGTRECRADQTEKWNTRLVPEQMTYPGIRPLVPNTIFYISIPQLSGIRVYFR